MEIFSHKNGLLRNRRKVMSGGFGICLVILMCLALNATGCQTETKDIRTSIAEEPNELKDEIDVAVTNIKSIFLVTTAVTLEEDSTQKLYALLEDRSIQEIEIGKDSANKNGKIYDFWIEGRFVFLSVKYFWKPEKKIWCSLVTVDRNDGSLSCFSDNLVTEGSETKRQSPVIQFASGISKYLLKVQDSATESKLVVLTPDDSISTSGGDFIKFYEGSIIKQWSVNNSGDVMILSANSNNDYDLRIYDADAINISDINLVSEATNDYLIAGPESTAYKDDFYYFLKTAGSVIGGLYRVEKKETAGFHNELLVEDQSSDLVTDTANGVLTDVHLPDNVYLVGMGATNSLFQVPVSDTTADASTDVSRKPSSNLDSIAMILGYNDTSGDHILMIGKDGTSDALEWYNYIDPSTDSWTGFFTISEYSLEKLSDSTEYKLDMDSNQEIIFVGTNTSGSEVIASMDTEGNITVIKDLSEIPSISTIDKIKMF